MYPKYFKSSVYTVKVLSEVVVLSVCTLEEHENIASSPFAHHWDPENPKYSPHNFEVLEATREEFLSEYYRVKGKLERIANQ